MSSATVDLLRHGQVHNPDSVVYGRLPDFHLSELGARMAEAAAADFAQRVNQGERYVLLATSPLTRARETAAPVARELGLDVHTDERLIEPANHFQGLHVNGAELAKPRHWPYLLNPLRPSWGEPYRRQVERMAQAARELAHRAVELGGDGARAIAVSHQLPIWLTRLSAEGRPLPHDPRSRQCNLASVTSLFFEDVAAPEVPRLCYREPAEHFYSGVNQLPGS